jgi:hypothetical protein
MWDISVASCGAVDVRLPLLLLLLLLLLLIVWQLGANTKYQGHIIWDSAAKAAADNDFLAAGWAVAHMSDTLTRLLLLMN